MDTGASVFAVTPSAESIKRLTHRYRRLYEQGVNLMVLAVCGVYDLVADTGWRL
mgnify:CR=1 FL=1